MDGHVMLDAVPRVTMSLVTFDGARWLPGCLASLAEQDFDDYELIIHDNGSRDDGPSMLRRWARGRGRVRLRMGNENLGYAKAHNRAIRAARGEYVLLLNQDVQLDPGFLSAIVEAFDAHPEAGSVQPRLRQLSEVADRQETLDTTGLLMGRDRRAFSRGQGRTDGPDHRRSGPVWGADGPAPAYRTTALREVAMSGGEVLDEDFFSYKEDVDLAWRLRLFGWSTWYEPSALGWHARGTGGTGATAMLDIARTNRRASAHVRRLSWRNQRLMQIKNEEVRGYLSDLPWIARREVLSIVFMLFNDPRQLGAIPELLRLAPSAMRKRRSLQARIRQRGERTAKRPPSS